MHLVGILFPHINDDARSKSHQTCGSISLGPPYELVRCSLLIELGLILCREIGAFHIVIFRHTRIIYAFYNLFTSVLQLPCCLLNGHTNTYTVSVCVDVEDTNTIFTLWAGIAQSVLRLARGWTVRGSNPGGGEIFHHRPDRRCGPPSLLYFGYRVTPGGQTTRAWR